MLRYDEEKTLALLESLKKEGDLKETDIQELPKLFQKSMVEVNISAGKGSFKTSLTEKELGITVETEETQKFMKNYVELGKIKFFPEEKEVAIDKITSRIRTYIKRNALKSGINGYYVSLSNFKEIFRRYEKAKKEFFNERDMIIDNYDTYKEIFKVSTKRMLDERGVENAEEALKVLLSKFPTKDEIKKNFYFDLIVQPYPVLSEVSISEIDPSLSSVIQEGNSSGAVETFYGIVGSILNNLFQRIVKTIEVYSENKVIPNRTKGGIRATLETALNDNHIVKNERVNTLIEEMRNVFLEEDEANLLEGAELLLAKIYGYADYLNIADKIELKGGMDVEEMLLVYELTK